MHLLYSLTAYPPSMGGAQIHMHLLAQQMKIMHSVEVLSIWDNNRTDWLLGTTLLAPGKPRNYKIDGVEVHRIGVTLREKIDMFPYVLLYYPLMKEVLSPIASLFEKKIEPYVTKVDLIHNVRIGREILSYASFNIARKYDIPFVLTPVHHPRWVGWVYESYLRLYKSADIVVVLTNVEKQTLVSLGVDERRIHVTGIGPVLAPHANPNDFLEAHHIDGPMILFLGQHYSYKGYIQLLQSSQFVWERYPEAHFVFIGPTVKGSEQVFRAYKDHRIHRLGAVDLQEKTDALSACTLLCVPSLQESFGGVYTEAWNFQKPVIGCNIPAVAEVITDGIDGLLVSQKSEDIAERICYLLNNSSYANKMGMNGQKKLKKRYEWPYLAKLTEGAYKAAVN